MSDNDSSKSEDQSSKKPKSKVVSSEKRDPKEALKYWTEERAKSAKPIPFPEPGPPVGESNDDEAADEAADEDNKEDNRDD